MFSGLSRLISPALDIGNRIFGNNQSQPAYEAPQITNIQTTNETAQSGSEIPGFQQANPFALFTPQVATGIARNLPAIGRALGFGAGGAVVGANLGGGSGELCPTTMSQPYNVNKETGCITITRKQQAALKDALKFTNIPTLAASIGLDPMILCQLLLKRFKARGRGITPASMRTTKRTIRQIKSLHNEVASMAARKSPVRRRAGAISQVNLRGSSS